MRYRHALLGHLSICSIVYFYQYCMLADDLYWFHTFSLIISLTIVSLYTDPYGITNKRKRKEVNMESFYSDRIPLSVLHEVKG